jgi:hypothetical protein
MKIDGTSVEKGKHHTLYYHRMGTKQEKDIVVAQFMNEPNWMM